ncbi:MAG: hypothetical protein JW873_00825 [Candidatus Saganbacteria bacterium]|nr:hypothetical protein [Candidatus Saganbacteria bacterium]
MSANEIRPPEKIKVGHPAGRAGKPHPPFQGHELRSPHRLPTAAERTRAELKIEFLEEKTAAGKARRERKPAEMVSRLNAFRAKNGALVSRAYHELQRNEPGLTPETFYRRTADGLAVLAQLSLQPAALTAAQLLGSLQPSEKSGPVPAPEALAQAYRLGVIADRLNHLYPSAERLLTTYLLTRQEKDEELGAVIDRLAATENVEAFLAAVELVSRLHDKQLERLDEAARKESLERDVATKKLAERKKIEQRAFLWQAAERLDADGWIALGRGVLAASAGLETELGAGADFVACVTDGLLALFTPGTIINDALSLDEPERAAFFAVAFRWNRRLPWLSEAANEKLKFVLGNFLSSFTKPYESINESLKLLENDRARILVADGARMLINDGRKELFNAAFSPETLLAAGRFGYFVRNAGRGSACLAALIRYGFERHALDQYLPDELEDANKHRVVDEAVKTAGPGIVQALIAAYGQLEPRLASAEKEPAMFAVINRIASLPLRPELITALLAVTGRYAARPEPRPKNKHPDIIPLARTARRNETSPSNKLISNLLCAVIEDQAAANAIPGWGKNFQAELQQLAADNPLSGVLIDERLINHRRTLLSLALSQVTVKGLSAQGRLAEARAELNRLLAEAARTGYKLSCAPALIGCVYAGLMERTPAEQRPEITALLAENPHGPAEEILLQGVVLRQVGADQGKANRVLAALKAETPLWQELTAALKRQVPEAAAFYVSQLLRNAEVIAREKENAYRPLRLMSWPYDQAILSQAVKRLSAAPDPLAATG